MWFAVLDGVVVGAVVALALLRPWQQARVGSPFAVLAVGVVGGLVGAGLGFTLLTDSAASGPVQVTPLVAAAVGAVVTLGVLRGWVQGDRATAVAALAAERTRVQTAEKARRRDARRAARSAPREPSALAELVVLALAAFRRR